MQSTCLVLLLLVTLTGTARPSPIELGVDPGLPFTAEQLAQALAPRVRNSSIAKLTVTVHGEGAADVEAGGATRIVRFGDRTGYAAARVVALAIYDLLLVDATPPALPRVGGRADPATARPGFQLAAFGGAMKGAGSAQPLGLVLWIALTGSLGDRLLGRVSVGSWWIPEDDPIPANAGLQAWPIRMDIGLRRGIVDLVAGPIVTPYVLSGSAHKRGVLAGVGASADTRFPIGRGLWLIASGGLDGFANRLEVRQNRELIFTTPRVALWVALGLAVEVGP